MLAELREQRALLIVEVRQVRAQKAIPIEMEQCLSLKKCRFANPSDRASAQGSGPIAWTRKMGTM